MNKQIEAVLSEYEKLYDNISHDELLYRSNDIIKSFILISAKIHSHGTEHNRTLAPNATTCLGDLIVAIIKPINKYCFFNKFVT